jgi:hypothetical protein
VPELKFDQPVPELTEQEDAETLAAMPTATSNSTKGEVSNSTVVKRRRVFAALCWSTPSYWRLFLTLKNSG